MITRTAEVRSDPCQEAQFTGPVNLGWVQRNRLPARRRDLAGAPGGAGSGSVNTWLDDQYFKSGRS